MFSSLKAKLIVSTVLTVVLFMSVGVWLNLRLHEDQVVRRMNDRMFLLSQTIQKDIIAVMLLGHGKEIDSKLREMADSFGADSIKVFNTQGTILHSTDPKEVGRFATEDYAEFMKGEFPRVTTHTRNGYPVYGVLLPIRNQPACYRCHGSDHAIRGILDVETATPARQAQFSQIEKAMVVFSGLLILAMVGGIYLIQWRFVNRPIDALTNTMSLVEQGDLSARADIHSGDEFGQLGRRLNTMIERLEKARVEVVRVHEKQMERADKLASLGEVASTVAHEIKNPLAGISGAIQVLARDYRDDPEKSELFKEILRQIDRMDRSVKDLLGYARVPALLLTEESIPEIVDRSLFLVQGMIREHGIEVVKDFKCHCKAIRVDAEQMRQVFLNLCLNAVQAMPGGGTLSLTSSDVPGPPTEAKLPPTADEGAEHKGWCRINVGDTGPGIPAEMREVVFKPFFTTKRVGTGLGLPICRRIVEQHHGFLTVESGNGKGTVFSVYLPHLGKQEKV